MKHGRVTRRRVLRSGVGIAGIGLRPGVGTAAAAGTRHSDWSAAVATWNLGLGAEFLSVARTGTDASVPERVGRLYRQVTDSLPGERMDAVAASLSDARPDVVGVQEAAVVRRGPRTDGAVDDPDAETVVVDLLGSLRAALDDRGVPYRPVSAVTNVDLEFPARVGGEAVDVRLTDRDVLLVRADVDVTVEGTATGTYDASLTLPIGTERRVEVQRGYVTADTRIRGRSLTAVTTHLEAALDDVRIAQASELAEVVASRPSPAVVLGDLNRGPDGLDGGSTTNSEETETSVGTEPAPQDAYARLTTKLTDPIDPGSWTGAAEHGTGTCCRPGSLRPPDPDGLARRIDHVLVDGLRASGSRRLGVDPVPVGDGEVWPSDHAGVLTELAPDPETPTATASDAETPESVTATSAPTTATGTPGFGAPAALVALCAAAWAALRRREG